MGATSVALFLLFTVILLYLVVLSFPAGVYTVYFTHLSNSSDPSSLRYPYLFIGPFATLLPFQVALGPTFLFLTVCYIGMFAIALRQGRPIVAAMKSSLTDGVESLFSNGALTTLISIGFLVFTASIIDDFVAASGSSVGNPFGQADPLFTLMEFTIAPLREEFGFRVLLIGVFAAIVCIGRPGKTALRSLWRPSASYDGGGHDATKFLVLGLGVFSSGLFGACHVGVPGICGGGGWDWGKLPEATYGGVVLAYLYIRYGFHVSVLAHWGVDYLGSVYGFFGQGAYNIPWASDPGYILQQILSLDLFLFFGVGSVILVAYVGLRKLFVKPVEFVAPVAPPGPQTPETPSAP